MECRATNIYVAGGIRGTRFARSRLQFEGTIESVISKRNWFSGLHESKWGFVECYNSYGEDQNEIAELTVNGVGLAGRIPTELAMLKNLLHL